MRLSPIAKLGLVSIFLGVVLYGGRFLWWKTRIKKPVNIPVSMSAGHIRTPEFKLNLDAVYLIEIAADQKKIPPDTLFCLLGYTQHDSQCPTTPSVVQASWVLSSDGQVLASGSTAGSHSAGGSVEADGIGRAIGSFDGEDGRRYVLDVDVLADGSKLAPANPRLQVSAFPWNGPGVAMLFYLIVNLELTGIILLITAGAKRWRLRKSNPVST